MSEHSQNCLRSQRLLGSLETSRLLRPENSMVEVRRAAYMASTRTSRKIFLPSTGLIHRGGSQTLPYPSIAHQRMGLGACRQVRCAVPRGADSARAKKGAAFRGSVCDSRPCLDGFFVHFVFFVQEVSSSSQIVTSAEMRPGSRVATTRSGLERKREGGETLERWATRPFRSTAESAKWGREFHPPEGSGQRFLGISFPGGGSFTWVLC